MVVGVFVVVFVLLLLLLLLFLFFAVVVVVSVESWWLFNEANPDGEQKQQLNHSFLPVERKHCNRDGEPEKNQAAQLGIESRASGYAHQRSDHGAITPHQPSTASPSQCQRFLSTGTKRMVSFVVVVFHLFFPETKPCVS